MLTMFLERAFHQFYPKVFLLQVIVTLKLYETSRKILQLLFDFIVKIYTISEIVKYPLLLPSRRDMGAHRLYCYFDISS